MKNMKTTEAILQEIFLEKNLSTNTQKIYELSVQYFEKHTGQTLPKIIQTAKNEEKNPEIIWSDSTLRKQLLSFRISLYQKHKESTATQYLSKILAIFRQIGLSMGELPKFSKKQTNKSTPIYPDDIPDRDLIEKCIQSATTIILPPLVLGLSSTGLSVVDIKKLTIKDYLESTKEYHNHPFDVRLAISEMSQSDVDIIPIFKSARKKTGIPYVTFGSPEFVKATNAYLLTRDNVRLDDPVFDIARRHVNRIFQSVNDNLGLGKINDNVGRFSPKMMRIYHASQLYRAGVSSDVIDILQGRTPKGIIYQSYIKIDINSLKEQYISALPYLSISEVDRVKTELDVVKEEKTQLKSENIELKKQAEETNKRIDNLEKIVLGDIDDERLAKLHKLL